MTQLVPIMASQSPALAARPLIADALPAYDPWLWGLSTLTVLLWIFLVLMVMLNASRARLARTLKLELAERERAKRALSDSEALYHSLVETLPHNIFRKGTDDRFTFVNSRFCSIVGRTAGEIIGKTDSDFFPPDLAEKYRADDRAVMSSGTIYDAVERHVTPDQRTHYVQVIKSPLFDANGHILGIQGIFWDVTNEHRAREELREQNIQLANMNRSEKAAHEELKQAQSRMVSTAKLAGLGEMVAGVAHEINNPLSFVSNNVCVLQRDLVDVVELINLYRSIDEAIEGIAPEQLATIRELWSRADLDYTLGNLQGLLNRTRDGLRRIQQIVKDLRVFARLDESDLNEVDLNEGIDSTVNIVLGHAKKKQVRVELELKPLPAITCYPAKINQVVMNLVSNAIDASHEGGTVSVRSDIYGTGVRIEVEDHGTGIPPEVRERIFDPFFTTKPVGIGTGLGLSISYGIVTDHGGTIEVDSTPGQGTKFTVWLPKMRPTRAGTTDSPTASALASASPL